MNNYIIKEKNINKRDVQDIAEIHQKEINQGFLSSLGEKTLRLIFLHAFESNYGILLCANNVNDNRPIGFLLGTTDKKNFYKNFLLRKTIKGFIYAAPKLFSLNRLRKGFETLLYPAKKEVRDMPKPELLDIAIKREYQGTGIAKVLFHEFCHSLKECGIREFTITTGDSLKNARRFYEKLGAVKIADIEIHRGQKTIAYLYTILD